jgi:(S)-2-hydroxyglutarate dehydrogenase
MTPRFDVCIVGGGLVGLAVGRALLDVYPGIAVCLVEKETEVGRHQSGHNSGVVHSGLYYRPGSLKASLCVDGRERLYALCEEAGIPYRRCGKVVVAVQESEVPALEELERRGRANGLSGIRRLDRAGIRELEPAAAGIAGLHVPETGVVDFRAVAGHLAAGLRAAGADLRTGFRVASIDHTPSGVTVGGDAGRVEARVLVNCAGLYADRVARMAGVDPSVQIVPFRGEYFTLDASVAHLVRALIYPVPDPRFPFLGVHFTRDIDDRVEVGPNAVLALGREHYRGARADWGDVREAVTYPGTLRLARRHLWSGIGEMVRSWSAHLYAGRARRLVPAVRRRHLLEGGAGIRAQAVERSGRLVDDFVIERAGSTVHVLNAPSPAATASLAIGRHIVVGIGDLVAP